MADRTGIAWTDATLNVARGCSRVSAGCENCYAERQAHRFSGPGKAYEGLTKLTSRGPVWTGEVRFVPELLEKPLRWKRPRRIFVNAMSDLFHENVSDEDIQSLFTVMAIARHHTFQILTKRPERMRELLQGWNAETMYEQWYAFSDQSPAIDAWPLPNVWLGVSVEDQKSANDRLPELRWTKAAVRFASYEPALGPVVWHRDFLSALDWLIVGGESGPRARPCRMEWIRKTVEWCRVAGVPVFVKQMGARCAASYYDDELRGWYDGQGWDWPDPIGWSPSDGQPDLGAQVRVALNDRKGADPAEWPEGLRVQEFPSCPR